MLVRSIVIGITGRAKEKTMQMAFFITQKHKFLLLSGGAFLTACMLVFGASASAAGPGSVTISEFIANPAVVSDANGEWVEIKNSSDATVNLAKWDIDGSTISGSVYLRPGQSAVICKNTVRAQNDGVVCDASSGFSLNNTSDTINLRDETNTVINSVSYTETNIQEGKSTHADTMSVETVKKYSSNNYGRPAHNQTTPPELPGEIRIHHTIDANKNSWPDFSTGEPHHKGRTVRLYKVNGPTWTLHGTTETTGKYYGASAKFIVDPNSYALCEVAEPNFTQSFARVIVGWYHAPLAETVNASGATDEYAKCIPVNVSSGVLGSYVFGDYQTTVVE